MQFWVIQAFNGISYGALLFLLASGLSLIFGVMRIVNLAHGSYFLLGGYVALTVIWTTGSWLLAIPVGALTIAVLGMAMERVFLRSLGFDALRQVLLTVGFALLFQQAALDIWGGDNMDIKIPPVLDWSVIVGTLFFPGNYSGRHHLDATNKMILYPLPHKSIEKKFFSAGLRLGSCCTI